MTSWSKQQITAELEEIGASWAGGSDKCLLPGERGQLRYHIYPDRNWPEASTIRGFCTLRDIEEYIEMRKLVDSLRAEGDYASADLWTAVYESSWDLED